MQALCVALLTLASMGETEPKAQAPMSVAKPDKPVRLMSAEKESRLRKLLPNVADSHVRELLADDHLLLYTESEMPRSYQLWSGDLQGVHLADYNISADSGEPYGNGNVEFPWGSPAGTHRSENVGSFRFLWLPTDDNGKRLPVVWYRQFLEGDSSEGYAWTFPLGTVFGEVLYVNGPDRKSRTFEMRLRRRVSDDWDVDVFRPFPAAADLAARIKELRPDWEQQANLASFIKHVEQPRALPFRVLKDEHPNQSFRQKMGVDELPALDDDQLVSELLTRTEFRSVIGTPWRTGTNGSRTFAPTTMASYHVVPKNYDAGFIEVDNSSCMRCHSTTNQSVDNFEFGRDWYGRIRGSDGIFSFHPFEPSTVSGNGYGSRPQMREALTRGGLLAKFNRKQHQHGLYQKIRRIVE